MNVLDLFSGIGGFSLGLEAAGMHTVAFCEREPFCQSVLAKHWPSTPIFDNVKTLDETQWGGGAIDLVCGGYPCQPFSTAGKRDGQADERHLWPEMLRIIRGVRPRWVIAENVAGHISLGFDEVATSLEAEGFSVWPFIIPASALRARHRRDRVWIIAHASGTGKRRKAGDVSQENGRSRGTLLQQLNGTVDVSCPHFKRHSIQGRSSDGSERKSPSRDEQLSRLLFPCPWPALSQSNVYGATDGVPNRVDRNHALGNAVVPQIPFLIGQAIMQYERELA